MRNFRYTSEFEGFKQINGYLPTRPSASVPEMGVSLFSLSQYYCLKT